MLTARNSDDGSGGDERLALRQWRGGPGRIVLIILAGIALVSLGCGKKPAKAVAEVVEAPREQSPAAKESPPPAQEKKDTREGYAVWYDVPEGSLPQRRAGKGELTAAYNKLPLGSMVRVTHLENGKSVIVRITDRGAIHRANIDLCKEAAEELGMVREGRARVRIEVLLDDKGVQSVPDSTGTAAHP